MKFNMAVCLFLSLHLHLLARRLLILALLGDISFVAAFARFSALLKTNLKRHNTWKIRSLYLINGRALLTLPCHHVHIQRRSYNHHVQEISVSRSPARASRPSLCILRRNSCSYMLRRQQWKHSSECFSRRRKATSSNLQSHTVLTSTLR